MFFQFFSVFSYSTLCKLYKLGKNTINLNCVIVISTQKFSANLEICQDDQNWVDSKFGDGLGKCKDMTLDWCENQGNYSIEAKRACPKACKVCKGEFYDLIYFLRSLNGK